MLKLRTLPSTLDREVALQLRDLVDAVNKMTVPKETPSPTIVLPNPRQSGIGGSSVNVAQALTGDGSALHPLSVLVDGSTVTINGSNQLQSSGGGSGITQLTGDGTAGPGSGSQAFTLANSGVSASTYGDSTHVPQITFDAKGRATAASNVALGVTLVDLGNSGTSFSVDFQSLAFGRFELTMTGNVSAITLSNPLSGGIYYFDVKTGAGGFTLAGWPAAVLWSGGTAPTLTTTASKVDLIVLQYNGTTGKYYGSFNQNY